MNTLMIYDERSEGGSCAFPPRARLAASLCHATYSLTVNCDMKVCPLIATQKFVRVTVLSVFSARNAQRHDTPLRDLASQLFVQLPTRFISKHPAVQRYPSGLVHVPGQSIT